MSVSLHALGRTMFHTKKLLYVNQLT